MLSTFGPLNSRQNRSKNKLVHENAVRHELMEVARSGLCAPDRNWQMSRYPFINFSWWLIPFLSYWPEAWKRYPFRAESSCVGHYRNLKVLPCGISFSEKKPRRLYHQNDIQLLKIYRLKIQLHFLSPEKRVFRSVKGRGNHWMIGGVWHIV